MELKWRSPHLKNLEKNIMAKHALTVECKLDVSEATAKACLQMVELFLNSNSMFKVQQTINGDGSISLKLINNFKGKIQNWLTTPNNSDDLISRSAAIDILCSECMVVKPEACSTIQEGDRWCEEVYTLLNLPSAEVATGVRRNDD